VRRPGGRNPFANALSGLKWMLCTQRHARFHAFATIAVVALAIILRIDATGWALLTIAISMVWVAETFNTAIEVLCDKLHPEHDAAIGRAKDLAAGAVLVTAIAAAILGARVLGPPCWKLLSGSH